MLLKSVMHHLLLLILVAVELQFINSFTLPWHTPLNSKSKCKSTTQLHVATTPRFRDLENKNQNNRPQLIGDHQPDTSQHFIHPPVGLQLPQLTAIDLMRLSQGDRVQKQSRNGRAGEGVVVVDVDADPYTVFTTLERFEDYNLLMPTIRKAKVERLTEKAAKAEYSLSKFMLKVNVQHLVIPEQGVIKFSLDETKPNLVMRRADGFWYTQTIPDRPQTTRVWLCASIVASSLVPTMIVDYAASRALPRATKWLRPYFAGLPHRSTVDEIFEC